MENTERYYEIHFMPLPIRAFAMAATVELSDATRIPLPSLINYVSKI
jgi:hypothetical protein